MLSGASRRPSKRGQYLTGNRPEIVWELLKQLSSHRLKATVQVEDGKSVGQRARCGIHQSGWDE
jgi:hypothetical protein